MLPDPQPYVPAQLGATLVADATVEDADRIYHSGKEARYVYVDDVGGLTHTITVNHQTTAAGRNRHLVKLNVEKIVSDPLNDGKSVPVSFSTHWVLNEPPYGFTFAQKKQIWTSFAQYITQGGDFTDAILAGQS